MKRETWSSNLGFVLAATGSAVGLGNIWKFPYVAGNNGGAVFIFLYLVLIAVLGAPILLAEMAVGRNSGKNAIDACSEIRTGWGFVGTIGVFGALIILSYYSVIGGWVIKYLADAVRGVQYADTAADFDAFSAQALAPVIYQIIFILVTLITVACGITNGIERVSRFSLPFLFIALVLIAGYTLTLPGATAGAKFLLLPDFSQFRSIQDISSLLVSAMGQVFFSLSLGMGTMITYGSYLRKDSDLQKNAILIPLFDFLIAVIAGLAAMSGVFAFGMEPNEGTGLLFKTLPAVFAQMRLGRIVSILFFALVLLAALTSSISLLQSIVAFLTDRCGISRRAAAVFTTVPILILGTLCSLSFGPLSTYTLFGKTIFTWANFLTDNVLMPFGSFFLCILVGYVWGIPGLIEEISQNGMFKPRFVSALTVLYRYILPVMIALLFATSLYAFFT